MKKITLLLLFVSVQNFAQYNFEQLVANAGSNSGLARYFTTYNNELFFASSGSNLGIELWKTNGTQAGTTQVADINTGFSGSSPQDFQIFNGFLYFTADVFSTTGRELYRTNGTTTTLVRDINSGIDAAFDLGTNQHKFIPLNNRMYFFARENSSGSDLWRTDGTTAGTQKMVDLNSFNLGSKDTFFTINGELLFVMDDDNENTIGSELYKYNEGTNMVTLVRNINPTGSSAIFKMTPFDNKLFFNATNGAAPKLYVSDGTETGTFVIENTPALNYSNPSELFVYNNELYFLADRTGFGKDLYKCKKSGTTYIIELVYNFNPSGNNNLNAFSANQNQDNFCIFNNELYFAAREQSAPNNGFINQIYKTNGTTTQIACNITVADVGATSDNNINLFVVYNQKLFFMMSGINMPNHQLWVANTTTNTVTRLTSFSGPQTQPQGLRSDIPPIVFNNSLFFTGNTSAQGDELWKMTDTNLALSSQKLDNIVVYPNPTNGFVRIDSPNDVNFEVDVYDILGKKLKTFSNQKTIDLSSYNQGTYFLKFLDTTTNQSFTKQIIKK